MWRCVSAPRWFSVATRRPSVVCSVATAAAANPLVGSSPRAALKIAAILAIRPPVAVCSAVCVAFSAAPTIAASTRAASRAAAPPSRRAVSKSPAADARMTAAPPLADVAVLFSRRLAACSVVATAVVAIADASRAAVSSPVADATAKQIPGGLIANLAKTYQHKMRFITTVGSWAGGGCFF